MFSCCENRLLYPLRQWTYTTSLRGFGDQCRVHVRTFGLFSDNFNFYCIICLYFGISNFKIYSVYTNSFMYRIFFLIWISTTHILEYILHFDDCFVQIWAGNVITVTHLYMLTKINWLSYLHTKTTKMLQTWQHKSDPKKKKKNSIHRLYWIYNIHFKIFRKICEWDNCFIVIQMPTFHWFYC